MKCKKCNKENPLTARYCAGCGQSIESDAQMRTRLVEPKKNLTQERSLQAKTQICNPQKTKTIVRPITQNVLLSNPYSVDIVINMDATSSMTPYIVGCKNQVHSFSGELAKYGLDFRLGLTIFRDLTIGEDMIMYDFTKSEKDFHEALDKITAEGGGPPEESALDALMESIQRDWRPQAVKIILLFSDYAPWDPDQKGNTAQQIIDELVRNSIIVYAITPPLPVYENIAACTGGLLFPISPDPKEFRSILNTLGKTVSKTAYLRSREMRQS